ncbi:MAG: sensor histidine kinase [Pseudonocardia sp.]|nr:sensor histidine kinase [Pseudonocardia sp.]
MRDLLGRAARAVLGVVRNILLAVPTLALLLLVLVGSALIPVFGIGGPVLVEVLGLVRAAASWQRRWAGRVLGVEVPAPYSLDDPFGPGGSGGTVWARLGRELRAATTWRHLGWLAWQSLAGPLAGGVLAVLGYAAYVILLSPDTGAGYVLSSVLMLLMLAIAVLVAIPLHRGQAVVSRWWLAGPGDRSAASARIRELTRTRASTVDAQAAELRRIERDLHDGTQARLVSLGLSIGLARAQLRDSPQADALLVETQQAVRTALDELRALVRGIHPPVLAERGLAGAVEALAVSAAVPVTARFTLPGRFEPAVESAVYFAAAEALTNISRHAHAEHARLELTYQHDRLQLVVVDDGTGGADAERGSGLRGIGDRLAAFDGTMTVTSPHGGPTEIRMELPCVPLSPRTSPCSATGSPACSNPAASPSSTP